MSFSTSSLKTLKVADLKDLCTKNSLSSVGKKEELIVRLTEFNEKNGSNNLAPQNEVEKASKSEVVNDINLSQNSTLESVPESNHTGDVTIDSKTDNGLSISGIVSSPPNGNGVTKSSQVAIEDDKNAKSNSSLSDSEKARLRAERFGISTEGSSIPRPAVTSEEEEKIRKRTERFGPSVHPSSKNPPQPKEQIGNQLASSLTAIASISQEEKLRLRAERFGVDLSSFIKTKVDKPVETKSTPSETKISSSNPVTAEEKIKLEARAKRFKASSSSLKDTLSPSELEKLAKRAERFGLNKS